MENWQVALIVLVALFVGAALPVLITLRSTLREANVFLATVGKSTDLTLRELTVTMEKVNHAYAQIEARAAARPAPAEHGGAGDGALSGVAATLGALAAPALLEWLLAFIASRKDAAEHASAMYQPGGDHADHT
jgi:hypothetical protein